MCQRPNGGDGDTRQLPNAGDGDWVSITLSDNWVEHGGKLTD